MPYEPTFPHPYLEAIDVTLDGGNNFQCVINPRDKITAYKITILLASDGTEICQVRRSGSSKYYKIGTASEVKLTIPSTDSLLPFQGHANKDDSVLVVNIPTELSGEEGLVNGKEYCWRIELTDEKGATTKSKEFYFTSASTPVVKLDVPELVASNRLAVSADYSQEQNLTPAFYSFTLYNKAEVVYTTGDIPSSDVKFEYDKLVSGEDYDLELTIILDNGMTVTENCAFSVSYTESAGMLFSTVSVDKQKTHVTIDYSRQINIDGALEGGDAIFVSARNEGEEYPEVPNVLRLEKGENVYWSKYGNSVLDFENAVQVIHWLPYDKFEGVIFEKIDEVDNRRNIVLSFSDGAFIYTNGQFAPEYFYLYKDNACAIAGRDEYSAKGEVIDYEVSGSNLNITLNITKQDSMVITPEMIVSFDGAEGVIKSVANNVITLDATEFSFRPSIGALCSIYDDEYRYVLADSDVINDDDVLIWNNLTPANWYLIYLLPDGSIRLIEDINKIEIEGVQVN